MDNLENLFYLVKFLGFGETWIGGILRKVEVNNEKKNYLMESCFKVVFEKSWALEDTGIDL